MKRRIALVASIAAALLAPVCAATAGAYHTYVERNAASGVNTRVWLFANCIGRKHSPFMGTAFVEHGTVTYRETTTNRCGLAGVPTREVWYQSPPGFVGVDKLTFPRGGGHKEIIAVSVQ
jgi:hypothetical protein